MAVASSFAELISCTIGAAFFPISSLLAIVVVVVVALAFVLGFVYYRLLILRL